MPGQCPKKIELPRGTLRFLYHCESLGLAAIAHRFNCSTTTVYNRMEEYGIERRTANMDKDRKRVECANCRKPKQVIDSHYRQFERFFCDNSCQGEYLRRTGLTRGENNGRWKGKVAVDCANCGEELKVYPSRLDQKANHLCDQRCRAEWYSKHLSGKNHPLWRETHENPYNGVWLRVRRRIRERDGNACRLCARDANELGRFPDVHHIIPVREFDDPQAGHTIENLVQLCGSCHQKMEILSPAEQRDRLGSHYANSGGA